MFFLSGAASNVLDYLMSMQSSSASAPPAGATDAGQGLFDVGASGSTNGGTGTSGGTSVSNAPAAASSTPWWSSPGTMNALLAVQGQSGNGASSAGSISQLFASLENDLGSGSTSSSGSDATGIQGWWAGAGSANGLLSTQGQSGVGAGAAGGISQLFATLESGAGFGANAASGGAPSTIEGWWTSAGSANGLFSTQGQSGVGTSATGGISQLFATLESGAGIFPLDDSGGSAAGTDSSGGQGASSGAGAAQGSGDASGMSQAGTSQTGTSQTVTNADGSTTTTITYPDGSTITMTTPAPASSTTSTSGTANFAGNLLERLIHAQAQMFATPGQSLSTLA